MSRYKIAVVQFPGANCDRDAVKAIEFADDLGMQGVLVHYNRDLTPLKEADGIVIPGGFSYQDRGRAGLVASLNSKVMDIIRAKDREHAPILGICNGNQILIEAGIVPGDGIEVAMAQNEGWQEGKVVNTDFYNRWVHIRCAQAIGRSAFTTLVDAGDIFEIPVAHAEGNYQMSEDSLGALIDGRHILFQYCDRSGTINPEFPVNPNGSVANIAALCNTYGNAVGIMPHPERFRDGWESDGSILFRSMHTYLEYGRVLAQSARTELECPRMPGFDHEVPGSDYAMEFHVRWLTTDNEGFTVGREIEKMGASMVKRFDFWRAYAKGDVPPDRLAKAMIDCATFVKTTKHQPTLILPDRTALLYRKDQSGNFRFEQDALPASAANVQVYDVVVQPRRDHKGLAYASNFQNVQGLPVVGMESGKLWRVQIDGSGEQAAKTIERMVDSRIFAHPITHSTEVYLRNNGSEKVMER